MLGRLLMLRSPALSVAAALGGSNRGKSISTATTAAPHPTPRATSVASTSGASCTSTSTTCRPHQASPAPLLYAAPSRRSMATHSTTSGLDSPTLHTEATPLAATPKEQPPPYLNRLASNFCRLCGSPIEMRVPAGEKEWRHVCSSATCNSIEYFNPKMVVGCIVEHEGKVLLCRRAIEPCRGLWTLPAGFMELRESSAEGAARETREEANAEVEGLLPYAHWDIPAIGQAYILFRGRLAAPYTYSSGVESLDTQLFDLDKIPFDELAFSSVSVTLKLYVADRAAGRWRIHHGLIEKSPGAASNDPSTFALRDHSSMLLC